MNAAENVPSVAADLPLRKPGNGGGAEARDKEGDEPAPGEQAHGEHRREREAGPHMGGGRAPGVGREAVSPCRLQPQA